MGVFRSFAHINPIRHVPHLLHFRRAPMGLGHCLLGLRGVKFTRMKHKQMWNILFALIASDLCHFPFFF